MKLNITYVEESNIIAKIVIKVIIIKNNNKCRH